MKSRAGRFVAVVLGCLAVVGVAACGGGEDSGSSSSSDHLSGTVTVWDFEYDAFPPYTESLNQLDAEFEKRYPDVTVNRVGQPYENYEAVYRAAFTAREGPDVMLMQPGASGVLSFKDGLEVLNDRITPEMAENITQWDLVTPAFAAEGDRYGVPTSTDGWGFYYNKKLFAKAGLPTKFEPQTWAEVREAGERLKAAGIQPFTGGNKEGLENSFWFSVGFQAESSEQQLNALAEGELPFTDDAVAKGFEPLIEMQDAGLYPSDWFSTPWVPNGYASFAEEKGAMVLGFWGAVGYWGEFNPALGERNVGFFFPPGNRAVGSITDFALSIPSFAENKDLAWKLIEFDTSKRANEVLFAVGGQLPNRKDVSLPADAPSQARELLAASRSPTRVVAPFAMLPSTVAFGALPQEINQVLQGRTSLEDAQRSIEETAERVGGG